MTDEVRMFPEILSALHYDSRIYLQGRSPQRQARFFETSIYLEDSGVLFIDGQPHTIHRGDVRFIPPGVTLCSDPPFSALSILLRFGPENEDYCRQFLEAIPPFFHGGEEMIDLFQQVIDLFSSDETGSKLLMNARMLTLLHSFYNVTDESRKRNPAVAQCIDYMKQNYNCSITLESLGQLTGYAPLHVLRLFKSQTGKTPHEFLQNLRMMQARSLLDSTRLSIPEVASAVGFRGVSTFQTLFKRTFGISPGKYRKHSEVFNR